MGSLSSVTTELTSPIQVYLVISVRVKHRQFHHVRLSKDAESRSEASVLGQHPHHQDCQHHHGKRCGGAQAGQGHQPQIQGLTIQIHQSQQEQVSLALQIHSVKIIIINIQQTEQVKSQHNTTALLSTTTESCFPCSQQQQQQ